MVDGRYFEKKIWNNRHISATTEPITTKFGMMTYIHPIGLHPTGR